MGRRPEPATLLLLKGTGPGRDSGGRIVPTPPNFTRAAPEAPDWLSDEARAEWDRVTPGLERLDLIKPEDRAALTVLAETWSVYVEAVARLRAEGLTVTNPTSGHVSPHPCAQIAHNAGLLLLRYAGEFGLTPVAERRLGTVTPPDDDDTNPYGVG